MGIVLLFRQAMPEAAQCSAVAGGCGGEERPSQYVVMGASRSLQCAVAFFGEDGEPFPPVSGVDFAADQAVRLETGHEMSRTGRAEQHPIGQLGIEALQHRAVQHHQRAPRLPLLGVEELVLGS